MPTRSYFPLWELERSLRFSQLRWSPFHRRFLAAWTGATVLRLTSFHTRVSVFPRLSRVSLLVKGLGLSPVLVEVNVQ